METKFESLESFFSLLNKEINYVVLRNFDYLPKQFRSELHGDIDILTDDLPKLVKITGAQKVFNKPFRVQYKIKINEEWVLFDFRYVGDQYYCRSWEENILKTKVFIKNCFFVMNNENLKYTLLYHALVHKHKIANDYEEKLKSFFPCDSMCLKNELQSFMKANNYNFAQPLDLSVVVNEDNVNFKPSFVCRILYSKKYHFKIIRFLTKILRVNFLK